MSSQAAACPALCVAGMGRSGTSLVSSVLQSAGLDIGRRLMGPGAGNVKGHFEDLDFYELHIDVLRSLGVASTGFTLRKDFPVRPQLALRARALVEARRGRGVPWGWKDPRTTLLLDFWADLVPEADFLVLFRPPWDVADSLFRRGDPAFRADPGFAVRVWEHYNRLALAFHDRHPSRCLFANSYRVAESPALLLGAVSRKFGLGLGPAADLYEGALLRRDGSPRGACLVRHHFPEVAELYERLNERAAVDSLEGREPADVPAPAPPPADWAFRDWLDLRLLEGQHRELQQQLERAAGEAGEAHEGLCRARAEVDHLRAALERVRERLGQSEAGLAPAHAELLQAHTQLRAARELIADMEAGKCWKLRRAWVRVKGAPSRAG